MASDATADNVRHIRRLAERIRVERPQTFEGLCRVCGVEVSHFEPAPKPEPVTIEQVCAEGVRGSARILRLHEEGCKTIRRLGENPEHDRALDHPDGEEVGTPGNRIWGGIVRDEPNNRLAPYLARGYAGYDAVYSRHYRDPLVYKAVQAIREVLVAGSWEMQIPASVPEEQRERLEEAVSWLWGKLKQVQVLGHANGWEAYMEAATWAVLYGFSIFEIVWYSEDGKPYPHKIAPRLASTVERWLMNERQDTLLAVQFQTANESASRYILPATGPRLIDQRVLLNTIGGQGNNYEGVPPTRTVDHLITYKQLLLTIAAAAAERFGSPVLATRFDPGLKDVLGGQDVDHDRWEAFFDDLTYMTAVETPTLQVPVGLMLEYVGAPGTMPELLSHIEYLDKQISLAWSNQGTTLGQYGHGSYALASVQEDDFLRGAPYYARALTRSLNDLIRRILKAEPWGFDLEEYPRIMWRLGGSDDNGAWFSDFKTFFSLAPTLPLAAQQAGLERLGLPPDTFAATDETQGEGVEVGALGDGSAPPQGASVQDSAFNGAQIASMLEVIMAYNRAEITRTAAVGILMKGFLLSREGAEDLVGKDAPISAPSEEDAREALGSSAPLDEEESLGGREEDDPPHALMDVPLGKSYALAEEIDPEREAQKMDRAEEDLTKAFEALQEAMAEDWQNLVADNEEPSDIVEDREAILEKYRPLYAEAIEDVMLAVGKESGRDLLEKMGVDDDPDLALDDALRLLSVQIADEAVNRSVGVMTEKEVERERGDREVEVAVLTAGTLALIASKAVSSAYNAGRDQAVTDANDDPDKPTVRHAVRSAVMDEYTCERCARLDGERVEVGSDEYYEIMPPNRCLGGARCRCVYAYEIEGE